MHGTARRQRYHLPPKERGGLFYAESHPADLLEEFNAAGGAFDGDKTLQILPLATM
jgi:hypothetical protein